MMLQRKKGTKWSSYADIPNFQALFFRKHHKDLNTWRETPNKNALVNFFKITTLISYFISSTAISGWPVFLKSD